LQWQCCHCRQGCWVAAYRWFAITCGVGGGMWVGKDKRYNCACAANAVPSQNCTKLPLSKHLCKFCRDSSLQLSIYSICSYLTFASCKAALHVTATPRTLLQNCHYVTKLHMHTTVTKQHQN